MTHTVAIAHGGGCNRANTLKNFGVAIAQLFSETAKFGGIQHKGTAGLNWSNRSQLSFTLTREGCDRFF